MCYKISNIIATYSIIKYDVGGCVICISNKVEYPDKEGCYINSTAKVVLSVSLIFPMQQCAINKMLGNHIIMVHIEKASYMETRL